MVVIGQAVDDRYPRVRGQLLDVAVGEDAGHDAVYVAGQHLGHVGHALPHAELDLVGREIEGLPSQVNHPHLEGDPGAQRWLLEDHTQGFALQDGLVAPFPPLLFELLGQVQDLPDLLSRQVSDGDQVFHWHTPFTEVGRC